MAERTSHAAGTISWTDLATTDQDAAKEFYGGLFGWEYDDMPVGEGAIYSMAQARRPLRGRDLRRSSPTRPQQGIPPHWNVYVTVEDVDADAGQGRRGRRQRASPSPFDVFDAGRMSVIADPTGAVALPLAAGHEHRRRGRQRAGRADLGRHRDDRRRRRRRRSTPRCSAGASSR